MATSGTVSTTQFTTRQVIDHAYRRCRLGAQQITSEMIDVANDQLYLILSNLANRGVQLWCIERTVLPLYEGQGSVPLPLGTVDLLNTNLRTLQEATGTVSSTSTTYQNYNDEGLTVTTVGIKWAAEQIPAPHKAAAPCALYTKAEHPGSQDWKDLGKAGRSQCRSSQR